MHHHGHVARLDRPTSLHTQRRPRQKRQTVADNIHQRRKSGKSEFVRGSRVAGQSELEDHGRRSRRRREIESTTTGQGVHSSGSRHRNNKPSHAQSRRADDCDKKKYDESDERRTEKKKLKTCTREGTFGSLWPSSNRRGTPPNSSSPPPFPSKHLPRSAALPSTS
ncbi:uncharacterized protein LOC116851649 isoform X1 [Odontomachus brunneus]|uniref:uncharacterized protein LOC116851649 isoform X1 n=1 Tax=Odontomachus brunneus TaxID=486640 RepID=UPI0013F19B11|nr:uncharacterized protein LOC116851649 isoform X1 [Odontomachus brunneus]